MLDITAHAGMNILVLALVVAMSRSVSTSAGDSSGAPFDSDEDVEDIDCAIDSAEDVDNALMNT